MDRSGDHDPDNPRLPAGCYANTACRDWEALVPSSVPNGDQCNDIAYQLVNTPDNLNIKVSPHIIRIWIKN